MKKANTWLFLPGFGQVGHTGMRAHEDVAWVQGALHKAVLGLRHVDATQRGLRQSVGWD